MALKTLVKVSEVNNLSDARYCAGMGVEMIGFTLDENHPKFIELAKLREIALWLSGVKVVGEFTGENTENINYLAHELKLDYIQLNMPVKPEMLKSLKKPVIQKLSIDNYTTGEITHLMNLYREYVSYFLLESDKVNTVAPEAEALGTLCLNFPVIIGFGIQTEDLHLILNKIKPAGIGLKGGDEIRPGLKSFEELSSILELLETEE